MIMEYYDLAIVGAGPVGLFATKFANLHGLKTITFEALADCGGQINRLFPNKKIKDIPGYNSIIGHQLVDKLKEGINSKIITNYKVQEIIQKDSKIIIDNNYQVKTLLITSGMGAFTPKKLPLPIDSSCEKHIHYFVKNADHFQDKNVAIFGGGDSALDWAMQMADKCKIVIIHRRDQFRGMESTLKFLHQHNNVRFLTPYLPQKIIWQNNQLNILLKKLGTEEMEEIKCDEAVIAFGFKSDNLLLKKWGLNLETGHVKVNSQMQSNIENIYAAGDACIYDGRVPMMALGFGEAQIAIMSIMNHLFPEKKLTIHLSSH